MKAPPPPPPAASTFVAVAVQPLVAHVFRGEEDLGSSPVMIELGTEPVELVAKAIGFAPRTFVVDGSEKAVTIRLDALPPPAAPGVPPRSKKKPAAKASSSSSGSTKKPGDSSGELVNPWD